MIILIEVPFFRFDLIATLMMVERTAKCQVKQNSKQDDFQPRQRFSTTSRIKCGFVSRKEEVFINVTLSCVLAGGINGLLDQKHMELPLELI